MKLWDFVKERMLEHATQQICEDEAKLSFEKAVIWAEAFAKKLNGFSCCAVLCKSEMASAMSLLACFASGVTAVPLSMRYGNAHCNKILDTISPDAIITDDGGEIKVFRITDSRYIVPDEHAALIMCTSGTTGKPKGAMLSEDNIIANVKDIVEYFKICEDDSILIARPLYHCAVLTGEFLTALIKGTKVRFYSEQFNPYKILELIRKYKITAFCATPTLLSMMAQFKRNFGSDELKHLCVSGECMGRDAGIKIANAFANCDIYHVYGLTEACPRVAYLPPRLFRKYPDFVGVPLKSVSIKLINPRGEPCADNEDGILWVKGSNIMLGYYMEPEKTAVVLKDGWLCTGDVAIINEAGLLKIKGRKDDLIIRSGMNIYPAEVEATLKSDKRVKEALVYGYENRFGTQIGLKIAGNFTSAEEVRQLCIATLPAFQIPSAIELLPELPKNGSGKIARKSRAS